MKRIVLIIMVAVFGTFSSSAQITKVNQEVFGMDCAPCAYGLERGLKKMDGVEKVRVSLNEGKAYLDLEANNRLSLRKLQEEVKRNGFSAQGAEVVLTGNAVQKDGQWMLQVNDESYLVSKETAADLQSRLAPGKSRVKGVVMDEEDGELSSIWRIKLTEIL